MRAMSVAVLVWVVFWNGLAPMCTAFEIDMVGEGTSIDYVDINTFASIFRVEVLAECAEGEAVAMRDTGQTPRSVSLELRVVAQRVNYLIFLNELDLLHDKSQYDCTVMPLRLASLTSGCLRIWSITSSSK